MFQINAALDQDAVTGAGGQALTVVTGVETTSAQGQAMTSSSEVEPIQ